MEIEEKPSKVKKLESVVLRETSKNRNVASLIYAISLFF
jgi:hypothetical protein